LPQIDLNSVLRFADRQCRFMDAFTHRLARFGKQSPDKSILSACIAGWATNTGLLRMGQISDIGYNVLASFGITEPGVDGEGIFFRNSKIRVADITDGTSLTLMVGERSFRWCQATWVGAVTEASMVPSPGSPGQPGVWNSSGFVLGHTFEGIGGPGSPATEINGLSSQHTQGSNFVFADGHVQFLSVTMNHQVYMALSTRAGGEAVEGDFSCVESPSCCSSSWSAAAVTVGRRRWSCRWTKFQKRLSRSREDLWCFQQGKPIRARPVGTPTRLLRWCRRRPLVALLLALLTLTAPQIGKKYLPTAASPPAVGRAPE
jgi:prepilin-type processing-associated H-X9-DG protein